MGVWCARTAGSPVARTSTSASETGLYVRFFFLDSYDPRFHVHIEILEITTPPPKCIVMLGH